MSRRGSFKPGGGKVAEEHKVPSKFCLRLSSLNLNSQKKSFQISKISKEE